jgi:hypothetical protein
LGEDIQRGPEQAHPAGAFFGLIEPGNSSDWADSSEGQVTNIPRSRKSRDSGQVAGRCVFCGARGLTKGHIWPDWIARVLPYTATHHEEEVGRFFTFTPAMPTPPYRIRTRQGAAVARKPRNTCLRCNGGWMSRVEALSKHFTTALIGGHSTIFAPFLQLATSALLCLIVMRLEFTTDQQAVAAEDRDWLRLYREPSRHWKIWIARFTDADTEARWSLTYGLRLESSPTADGTVDFCDARVTTFVIGRLVAHIFYSTDGSRRP